MIFLKIQAEKSFNKRKQVYTIMISYLRCFGLTREPYLLVTQNIYTDKSVQKVRENQFQFFNNKTYIRSGREQKCYE